MFHLYLKYILFHLDHFAKSTNIWSIIKIKSTEDSIKRIDLKLGNPVGNGMDFKINRQKVRTLHVGWSPWSRPKLRIFGSKHFISVRKIEIPETFNDIPDIAGKGIGIRLIFTKICNNKVLVVSMPAAINR